jgi:pimeloyl-ACP methyl ester carboxylesterase
MEELQVEGLTVRYRASGQGPGVVALHCSSSHSGQWAALADDLAADFAVFAPDLHGYGRSDALPRDGRAYFERDAAIVTALAAKHGAPLHLVGHSLGGTVALRVALRQPQLVASLTLIEPVQFSILEEIQDPARAEYHDIASRVNALVRLKQPRQAAQAFVDFWVAPGAFQTMDAATRDYVIATIGRVTDDWAGCSLVAPGQARLADCAALAMPCQIIRGGATRASARAITQALANTIPGATLHEVAGVGHMAAATKPDLINPLITGFVRRLVRATPVPPTQSKG